MSITVHDSTMVVLLPNIEYDSKKDPFVNIWSKIKFKNLLNLLSEYQ